MLLKHSFAAFRYCLLLPLFATASALCASDPDTLNLKDVHTALTLECGDKLMVFDKGGADANGVYVTGYAVTNWLYLRTSGTGSPVHVQIDATLASDCSLTVFNEYPSDDQATSPSFPTNYPGTCGIYRAEQGTSSATVVSTTGKVSIRFSKTVVSQARTCNFRIRIWTSDTSEVYNIRNSAITANSAHVSWSDSSAATSWTVRYGTNEYNLDQSMTVSTTEATLTGLQPNSPYYIRIYNNAATTQELSGYCTTNSTMIITRGDEPLPVGCLGEFTDLSSSSVICTYGFYDNPDENYGVQANRHTVLFDASAHDPIIGDSLTLIPSGYESSVRLGNSEAGNESESIIYRFRVDASQNDMLLLRYAVVMQNPSHPKDRQPRMHFQILREDGSELNDLCYEAEFVSTNLLNGELPWHDHGPRPGESVHVLWHDWTAVGVNLTPLDGEVLYIKLVTKDCNDAASNHHGEHFCYAYFTLQCAKKDITYNGCDPESNLEFVAPEGFDYDWHVQGSATTLSTERTFSPPSGSTSIYECTMMFRGAGDAQCSFSMTVNPSLAAAVPQARFSSPDTVEAGTTVLFDNTSYVSSDADGDNPIPGVSCNGYLWDFGDGATSQSDDATHQYAPARTDRTYTVTLTAYISESCTSQYQKTVVVKAQAVGYPDNMESVDCAFSPSPTDWSIRLDAIVGGNPAGDSICTLINPLVGDLDGDGIPEIVCFSTRNAAGNAFDGGGNPGSKVKNVVVYDGRTLRLKAKFDLPAYVSAFEATPFGLAKPYGADALMVFACMDNKLYAYKLNGGGGATQVWGGVSYGSGTDYATTVGFADFNNDSIPEVYVRNKIFNLVTGDLLLSVNTTNRGASFAHVGSPLSSTGSRKKMAASFASDLVGDANCELLLGNEIHSIHITNPSGTAGNSSDLYATAPSTGVSGISADGHVQVADFNLDGNLDIFFSNRSSVNNAAKIYAYVWDVYNNTVSTPIVENVTQPGKSIPLIADIDNDGTPEVVLHCGIEGANIRAYKYNASTQAFSLFWTKAFNEDSYSNSMTLFDFNQDGENELLICDQFNVSIVNGSTPALAQNTISTLAFREITIMQYPIIVDVDNDGAAEIVFVGKQNGMSFQGTLNICRSNGEPWAPARPVWNQYMYNITNVNKDLTIPAVLFNNAHAFTDPDSGVVRRPFNNFLQQATSVDFYGRPYYTAADLQPSDASVTMTEAGAHLQFDICNVGASIYSADTLYTQIYINSYGATPFRKLLLFGDAGFPLQILPDSCKSVDVVIPYSLLCPYMPFDSLAFAVNDIGLGVAEGGLPPECNIDNNFFSLPIEMLVLRDTIYDSICQAMPYNRNGFVVPVDTTAILGLHQISDTTSDATHCQIIRTLMLMVQSSFSVDTEAVVCDSLVWRGQTLTVSGYYTDVSHTAGGCDSTVTLTLTVHFSSAGVDRQSACDSLVWIDGRTYTTSVQNSTFTIQNSVGCDSLVTLDLSIFHSYAIDTTDQACGSYIWNETEYEQSGDYTLSYTTSEGCDSVWTLHLSIYSDTVVDSLFSGCDSVLVYGASFSRDTQWVDSLTTVHGCDSLVRTQIFVYPSTLDTIVDSIPIGAVYTFDGQEFSDSGVYFFPNTSLHGCDSLTVLQLLVYNLCSEFLQFPNLVTPNDDGINDRFVVKNLVEEGCYIINRLTIYNRWGMCVYDAENITKDDEFWDPASEKAPAGTYYFIFRGKGVKGRVERRGLFELIY